MKNMGRLGILEELVERKKNFVIMLAQAYPDVAETYLRAMDQEHLHPIVHQAIHYALNKPLAENLLWKTEPEILRKYRAKYYPTMEEMLVDKDYYIFPS